MRLNPSLASWYRALLARPEFAKEVTDPLRLRVIRFFTQKYQALTHTTLQNVTGV
jgi:hypothetical protein